MKLLPYFFPTQTLVVDDSESFLKNFHFLLPTHWACQSFIHPQEAYHTATQSIPTQLRPSGVEGKLDLSDETRFQSVSSMVIDYDMPEQNGLELCQKIRTTPIRTLLLTGVADEKTGIYAFNQGWIDCFISKSESDIKHLLKQYLSSLQQQFFEQYVQKDLWLQGSLDWPSLAESLELPTLLNDWCQRNQIHEYYFSDLPLGFLGVTAQGKQHFLLLGTQQSRQAHYEIAEAQGAPEALLHTLNTQPCLSCFPTEDGYFRPNQEPSQGLFEAQPLNAQKDLWYTELSENRHMPWFQENILSYEKFLDAFDQNTNDL